MRLNNKIAIITVDYEPILISRSLIRIVELFPGCMPRFTPVEINATRDFRKRIT